jgi:PIN domain nuclease of toxin-antitoxin system
VILLDTHAWIWWIGAPDELSPAAREAADRAADEGGLSVSAISAWEAAMLVERGRLALSMPFDEWLRRCEALPFLHFVPVDHRIAVRAVHLPGDLHGDPADRIIVATALDLGVPLVTRDRKLQAYPHVRTVW